LFFFFFFFWTGFFFFFFFFWTGFFFLTSVWGFFFFPRLLCAANSGHPKAKTHFPSIRGNKAQRWD
jgi:hypothetical protein